MNIGHAAALLLSTTLSALVAHLAWRRRPAPGARTLAFLALALVAWSLAYGLSWLAVNPALQHLLVMLSYVGVVACPPLVLVLVLEYTQRAKVLTRWVLAVLVAEPIVTLLLMATDSLHGWFFGGEEVTTRILSGGPWFWINAIYGFALVTVAALLLVGKVISWQGVYRLQSATILIAVLVPVVAALLGVAGMSPVPDIDLTPFAFTVSCLLIAFGLFRLGFLQTVPVARDQLIDSMAEGVVVVDVAGRVVDLNPAARALLGLAGTVLGRHAREAFVRWPDVVQAVDGGAQGLSVQLDGDPVRCIEASTDVVRAGPEQVQVATLITLRDVTERVQITADLRDAHQAALRELGERLRVEEALRRRVAELHGLQRISELLAGRMDLPAALQSASTLLAPLFEADSADIHLLPRDVSGDGRGAAAGGHDDGSTAGLVAGQGAVQLTVPLVADAETLGVLILSRPVGAQPFAAADEVLARTAADLLAAVIRKERLHEVETLEAASRERQRIARDLHDAVTQSIFAANLIAEGLAANWERNAEQVRGDLDMMRRLIRSAFAELRILLYELRPETLATAPLETLLERLADALAGQGEMAVEVRVQPDLGLPAEVRAAIYRIAQEALNNTGKYAEAQHVAVVCGREGEDLLLTVRDDGCGFDAAQQPAGMGQSIMRERAAAIGAELDVMSAPGRGTTVTVRWRSPQADRRAAPGSAPRPGPRRAPRLSPCLCRASRSPSRRGD